MSASSSGEATKVTFPNQLTSMAGLLFIPANMDLDAWEKHSSLVAEYVQGIFERMRCKKKDGGVRSRRD